MTNLSIVGQEEVSKNQVLRSNVAKTQQPDAERLKICFIFKMISIYNKKDVINTYFYL